MPKAKRASHPAYRYDIADYDERIRFLIGWPGYRTSRNRSGLGYAETQAELAHMQGLMFRWLVTGKFKTRNPVYLFFIIFHGISLASPLLLLLLGVDRESPFFRNIFLFLPYSFIGVLLLANAILSLIKCDPGESITGE